MLGLKLNHVVKGATDNLVIFGSLPLVWYQAITWNNYYSLSIECLGTKLSKLKKNDNFSSAKINFKMGQ